MANRYGRDRRVRELLSLSQGKEVRLAHRRAQQHIAQGFNRRVLMIDESSRAIHERISAAGTAPLSALLVPALAIDVNAFWLNICGALDNLAWAFAYERDLIPGAREDIPGGREKVGLFKKDFLKALGASSPTLHATLVAHEPWSEELRRFRDPAAHRIPIYPIPGVMNETQGEETKRLYAAGNEKLLAGDWDEGMELIHRGYTTGEYQPLVALSHNGTDELLHLGPLVDRDELAFVTVAGAALDELLGVKFDA